MTSTVGLAREEYVLVLQGGGALGSYQAGVYEVLAARNLTPHWVAGISIGAINAALIAGNPKDRRVDRLHAFWDTVTSSPMQWNLPFALPVQMRSALNDANASMGALLGLPGFFRPQIPSPQFQLPGSVGALSYYDTEPLRVTLEHLVDFDLLNSGTTRLSVGAVNVCSGNFAYFDTARQTIDARHIMASGALPPGFPPVEIDGQWYWDGGLVSNTPLEYVLDQPAAGRILAFQVDLFVAEGPMPRNLMQVAEREKDIRFSSRTRLNTTTAIDRHALARAAHRMRAKVPTDLIEGSDVQALRAADRGTGFTVVHLIHRRKHYETQSKDYEFSRASMLEHWEAGRSDMAHTLDRPEWRERIASGDGVQVFDLTTANPHHGKRLPE